MKLSMQFKRTVSVIACITGLGVTAAQAQTVLSSNSTGTNDGFYYTFWKDSGDASMTLQSGGRYTSQWTNATNNWVGGKGWNPGNSSRVVSYSGNYGVSNSQNSYLAFYGWTRSPLIEYYVIESYGSYNPSTCSGGTDYGSFTSDGATYNVRRCERVNQPSIDGTQTFYQYFSVRSPKKAFGAISGTITFANHAAFWASKGLALGSSHDYQVMATEGYQSAGNSDITVTQGSGGNSSASSSSTIASSSRSASSVTTTSRSSTTSSSSVSIASGNQCNWYGTATPLCTTTTSGWGWEGGKSCVARSTCAAQPSPYGIIGSTSSNSVASSSRSSTPVVSSSRSSVATSVSSTASTSKCQHIVGNSWNGGFAGSIRITNNGNSVINGWNLTWQYGGSSTRVTSSWNANVSGSNPYTASNLAWNATIQPGQSVEFGFQASGPSNASVTISGAVCN